MRSKAILLQSVGFAILATALQPAPAALAQSDDVLSEEIFVFGRKREERFIDVPVISSILGAQQLENFQTTDFFNAADRLPGVIVGDNVGNVGANVTIRGIGSSTFNSSTEGAISVNIDGIQFSHGDVLRSAFFDVSQVEVLKGPQALFFGKNSPGGVLSLQTNDPGDEFEVFGNVGYEFEADAVQAQAVISGPIADWLKARLAISYSDQKGFFNNIAQPTPGLGGAGPEFDRISNEDNLFMRLTLTGDLSDRFSYRLKVSYEDRGVDGDGGHAQLLGCDVPFDPIETCTIDRNFAIADLDPNVFVQPLTNDPIGNNGVPFQDSYRLISSLELNFDITEDITITSVTGYSEFEHDFLINGTFQPGTADQLTPFIGFPGSVTIAADNVADQRFITEELRVTSQFEDSPLNFMVGIFFEDGRYDITRDVRIPSFGTYLADTNIIDVQSFSAFGQIIYDVSDTLEIAGGLRYTDEERDLRTFDNATTLTLEGPIFGVGEVNNAVPNLEFDDLSPEITITWRPSTNLTVFAAYKEGFKAGSFNVDQPLPIDRSYDQETARGGEIGVKSILAGGSVRLNAAAYYYEYDDLQVSRTINLPGGGGTLLQVVNAASATVKGIEADITYTPPQVEGLSVFAAFNLNSGEFDDFQDAACYGGQTVDQGCNSAFSASANQAGPGFFLGGFTGQDLSGQNLPRSPDFSASFGFDYDRPIGSGGLNIGVSSNTSYTSEMVLDTSYNPRTFQDGFVKTNASVRLYPDDKRWEVAFIGNNLNNKIVSSTCFSGAFDQAGGLIPNPSGLPVNPIIAGSSDQAACFTQPGREMWVRLTWRPVN